MRLLLDTNVLLFVMARDARVEHLEGRIVSDDTEVYVSAASYWEVAIKIWHRHARDRCRTAAPGSQRQRLH